MIQYLVFSFPQQAPKTDVTVAPYARCFRLNLFTGSTRSFCIQVMTFEMFGINALSFPVSETTVSSKTNSTFDRDNVVPF